MGTRVPAPHPAPRSRLFLQAQFTHNTTPARHCRTHTCLEPVRTSARKHLVDAQHVERVHAHAQVERVLARILHHVLVGCDPCSLERLGRDVLFLPAAGEAVDNAPVGRLCSSSCEAADRWAKRPMPSPNRLT